ncbi:MAG: type II toxin-antitoxin system RelE/ParE family toxin [Kiritimatiellae bacterium]|nr:type II toxin-antitoxin system RelE/ParE family toxin [Kiritimatiellia bacterium]
MTEIFRSLQATEDIISIAAYLGRERDELVDIFIDGVEATIERLAAHPRMGACGRFDDPRLQEIRFVRIEKFPNHLLFYRLAKERIEIVRVLHGARDIPHFLG